MYMTSCDNSSMLHPPEADLPSIVLVFCHQIRIVQQAVIIEKSLRCSLVVGRVGQLNVAAPCRETTLICSLQNTCMSIMICALRFDH